MAVRAEKAGAVLVTRPPVTEQPTPSTIRPAPDETAFVLPTGPAEPSLYDEVIEAGLRGVDDQETAKLLMLYHRSELDQLESAWRARGGSPTDALPFLPDRDNWTKKQRERRWISRTELADYLGVSTRTIDTQLASRRIEGAYKTDRDKPNSHWRIPLEEAEKHKSKLTRRP